jgi:hypothetical protein
MIAGAHSESKYIWVPNRLIETLVEPCSQAILFFAFVQRPIPSTVVLVYIRANSATMREFGLWLSNNLLFFFG